MRRGLIGYPLGHSFSKPIHEYLTGLPYEIHEVEASDLDTFLKEKDFEGINVTIPYKEKVIPYLDDLDYAVKKIGACNCIVNKNGHLKGYNTDADGFRWSITKHAVEISNKTVAIIGAGGASKAVRAVVESLNPKIIYQTDIVSKNGTITNEELLKYADEIEVLINTTPCGMYPKVDNVAVDIKNFKNVSWVIDVVYNPLKTKLVLEAEELGIKTLGGIEMLVAQAYIAAEYFNEARIDEDKVETCLKNIISQKRNLVLIGMPSSGKTTISNLLAKELNLKVIDMDQEIVKRCNKEIKDIFKDEGEAFFRNKETELSYELGLLNGFIISTGGGIIKNKANIENLKRNGIIIYLQRDFDKLVTTDDRPLSSNSADLLKVYEERKDIYPKYADLVIDNNGDINDTIKQIINLI